MFFKNSKKKSFLMNLITNKLPILANMAKRQSYLIKYIICSRYKKEKKMLKHILEYIETKTLLTQVWDKAILNVEVMYRKLHRNSRQNNNHWFYSFNLDKLHV